MHPAGIAPRLRWGKRMIQSISNIGIAFQICEMYAGRMSTQVRSVSLAFAVLRTLAARADGATLSEVARAVDLGPSSALNLLRTLVAEGAVERAEDDRRYRLVPGWSATGRGPGRLGRLIERVRPPARAFAEAHECTVGLWQVTSPDRVALAALWNSGAATRITMVIGQRQPIGSGSTGRALAALEGVDEAELKRRFDKVRWQRPLAFETYREQVREAAMRGYAIDDGFSHSGICSLAAAIPSVQGLRLCLTVSTFAGSRDAEELARIGIGLHRLASLPLADD